MEAREFEDASVYYARIGTKEIQKIPYFIYSTEVVDLMRSSRFVACMRPASLFTPLLRPKPYTHAPLSALRFPAHQLYIFK